MTSYLCSQVKFTNGSNDLLLSVLLVEVTLLEQRVDRVFHVYHSEGMFMRKEIHVPLSGNKITLSNKRILY